MILSCGEALIGMLPRTSTQGEDCLARHAGGAVFNTAVALGRLGAASTLFSGVSDDMPGEIPTDALTASKVGTRLLARSGRPTTITFVKLVNGQASYAFHDEATAGRMLSLEQLPDLPASLSTLFLGGISRVNDPAASTYEALQTRKCGARVTMVDPNIRPGFIAGKETEYRARILRMIKRADIVKLSDKDLHWLEGADDLTALARDILAKGPKVVFITEGAAGARAVRRRRTALLPRRRSSWSIPWAQATRSTRASWRRCTGRGC